MATLDIRFYSSFSKRDNSTKQPANTDLYTTEKCILKENTSIISPTVILSGNHLVDYTYAYIPDFNRYYFVSEPTSDAQGLVTLQLSEDYLATWKTNIQATNAMVLRSSSNYDKWISDNGIQVLTTKQYDNSQNAGTPDAVWSLTGCYLLVVAAKGVTGADGFTIPYLVDKATMQSIADFMFDENQKYEFLKFFQQPFNSIISCKWLPFDKSQFTTVSNPVYLGGVPVTGVTGDVVTHRLRTIGGTVNFPTTLRKNDFRDMAPYARCNVTLPCYGKKEIDLSNYVGKSSITFDGVVDCLTGDVTIQWENESVSYNVAADVPIAQVSNDTGGFISGLTALGTGAVTGGLGIATATTMAGLAVAGVTAGLGIISGTAAAAMSYAKDSVNIKGNIGNYTNVQQFGFDYEMEYFTQDTSDPENATYKAQFGRPLNIARSLNGLSGFVMCSNASVTGNMFDVERESVNSFLNSGFFME